MKKRVLIYGMNYAPEFAGVGKYSGEISEYLAGAGDHVTVVTTPAHYPGWRVQKPYRGGMYHFERLNGVHVLRCPLLLRQRMGGLWRLLAPFTFALTSAPIVLWQILRCRPEVAILIVPTMFGAPLLLLGAALVGARTIAHVQDLEVDAAFAVGHLAKWRWLKHVGTVFDRFVMQRFEQVITISDRMAEKISQKGVNRDRIAVIRNWVDLEQIRPLEVESQYRSKLGYRSDDYIVQYCGNIGRKQGLGVLLDAASRLEHQPGLHFVIAGEGPAKAELMARYGHLANVRFLPFQPNDLLSEFLGLANLHALPQDAEAADLVLPSKLGGMLASSKPLVVMATPETELGIFLRGNAILVTPGDSAALARVILDASSRPFDDAQSALRRLRLASSLSKREGLSRFAKVVAGTVDQAVTARKPHPKINVRTR